MIQPVPALVAAVILAVMLAFASWLSRRSRRETARRETVERDLSANRQLLEAVFNATSDAILVLDDAFHVLMANQTGARRFGLEIESMLGRDILELTDAAVADSRRDRYRQALDSGKPVRFTDERAGSTYDNVIYPLPVGPGGRQRLAIYARDITERLAAEKALGKSRERLAKIFRLSPVIITISSMPEGRLLDVNEAFTAIIGYTRQEALGHTIDELGIWTDPGNQDRINQEIVRAGLIQNFELSFRLRDGRIVTGLLSCTPLEAYGQPCLLSVVVDITARKAMEEALRLAKESAEAANQAKSRFLSTMSHEIRTPMNSILGMVDVLRETPLSQRQKEFLRTLELAGESLLALLSDILDLSGIESGTLRLAYAAYDPARLVRQVGEMLEAQAARKELALSVAVEVGPGLEAYGDEARLRQILINLVGNAIKFTPSGEIRLSLARIAPVGAGGEELLFSVADTGIGIPPEKQRTIFEPFTQVDSTTTRAYGGTGLGLAISALLAEGMGGRLWVESRAGPGSTFYCAVPLDARPHPQRDRHSSPDSPADAPQ